MNLPIETTNAPKTRYILVWVAGFEIPSFGLPSGDPSRGDAEPSPPLGDSEASPNTEMPPGFSIMATCEGFWILRYDTEARDPLSQPKAAVKRVREFLRAQWKGLSFVVRASKDPVTAEVVSALRQEWLRQREYSGSWVTLNFPLTIPAWIRTTDGTPESLHAIPLRAEVRRLLAIGRVGVQGLLHAAWTETELVNTLEWEGPAWKASGYSLGKVTPGNPQGGTLPSRVGRCIVETAARIVRSQAERRRVFETLKEPLSACSTWEEVVRVIRSAREAGEDGEHLGLYWNVAEQAWNFRNRKDKDGKPIGIWPYQYTEMQGVPRFERDYLTLAADDGGESGQVVQIRRNGNELDVELRLPTKDHPEGIGGEPRKSPQGDWTWRSFSLELPARVVEMLDAGGVLQAPDLRITKRGRVVLDLKVKASPMGKRKESGAPLRIVSFDWGVKRILTAVAMERTAEGMVQISRPFFLHTDGLYEKLAVMREKIGHLDAEIRGLRKLLRVTPGNPRRGNRPGVWDPLRRNRLAVLQKNRERAWGRYAALQTEMAHLAANFLLLLGEPFGATVFAGEWLGSLRSQNLGRRLNWLINSQIRSAILQVLRYKARRQGLRVATVWPRGTSHRCPRCDDNGTGHLHRVPPHFEGKVRSSRRDGWFVCPRCGANGDRDYMAALNIGIEWDVEDILRRKQKTQGDQMLKGKKLAAKAALLRKGVPYKDALDLTTLPLLSYGCDLLVCGLPGKVPGGLAHGLGAGVTIRNPHGGMLPATLAWITPIVAPLGNIA